MRDQIIPVLGTEIRASAIDIVQVSKKTVGFMTLKQKYDLIVVLRSGYKHIIPFEEEGHSAYQSQTTLVSAMKWWEQGYNSSAKSRSSSYNTKPKPIVNVKFGR